MTDTHSHILFDLDDGSTSIKESLELLKKLSSIGFKNVILTPHYIKGSEYSASNEEKIAKFKILQKEIIKEKIKINIFLGNEIFISNDILSLLENNEISSLNNSPYLLIELPFHNQILSLEDIIYEIKLKGYIPIIAHPERYTYFQDNHSLVDKLKEEEVLFQCNYSSILGQYDKKSEKLLKYMLKKKYVDYLGTDIHHIDKIFVIDNFEKIIKQITKITDSDYLKKIINNCNHLVENR